jgi:hypothetical protein
VLPATGHTTPGVELGGSPPAPAVEPLELELELLESLELELELLESLELESLELELELLDPELAVLVAPLEPADAACAASACRLASSSRLRRASSSAFRRSSSLYFW